MLHEPITPVGSLPAPRLQDAATLTGRLFEIRQVTRELLGDDYPARVAEYRELLRDLGAAWRTSHLATLHRVLRDIPAAHLNSRMLLIAAAIENIEAEPSESEGLHPGGPEAW
jgi:hypothetical protein